MQSVPDGVRRWMEAVPLGRMGDGRMSFSADAGSRDSPGRMPGAAAEMSG